MRPTLIAACAALACLALTVTACDESDPGTPTATGAIRIDVEPDATAAPWQVSGPNGYQRGGSGDELLDGLRTGTYTVTWLEVAGYTAPAPTTLPVPADSTVTFTGAYQEAGLPFPDTADKLMQNFRTMYETMDLAAFATLMHPDHLTILQQSTVNEFPDVGPTLDLTEEQRIHERMFSGHDVTDPDGALVPGIQSITFQTFARQGTWGASPPNDPIPDTLFALYDVVILLDRGPLYSTLKTQGALKFYVVHRDSTASGVTRPYFQLRGQVDLTADQKAGSMELSTWGVIKAIFR